VAVGLAALLLVGLTGPVQAQPPGAAPDTTRITFDEAIRTALDQNTDVKRAQAQVREAETQVQAEWLDFAPDLDLSTDVTRRFGRNFSQIDGEIITRSTDFLNLNGRSSLTLFNGFENAASLQAASSQAEAQDLDLQRTRREVVFTVMDQYIALVESREIVRVRREQLSARRQQLRQIQEFVDAGSRPVSDLYQEQANVAEAEQQLLQAERERAVNKTRLIQTLQLDPRAPYRFAVPDLADDSLDPATYDLSALIDEAFRNRLDLQAAQAERRAARKSIRAARSSYYPRLSISGNYGTDWTSRPRPIPDPQTGQSVEPDFSRQLDNNRSGSVSLSLNIPIFDRFQRETRIERAQVDAQNATYELQDQRQRIALQVRQAYLDYKNAVQQLEAANKRLRAARQARAAARERYNLGAASIVELQNTASDFVDAASQQVRARYTLLFRKKQIDYHVGRLTPTASLFSPTAGRSDR
jgi:outer membrane protein